MKEKREEARLRRLARRYGLEMRKSRRRDPDYLDYGLYGVFDPETGGTMNPSLIGRYPYSWTLEEVREWLEVVTMPGLPGGGN